MFLLSLAACAGGSAKEARRGQEHDVAAGATVPALQATRTAGRFFGGTPEATAPPPPMLTLESLVLTLQLGSGDAPAGDYSAVPTDGGTAYAAALLHGLRSGQVVNGTWTSADGTLIHSAEITATGETAQRWYALPLPLNGSLPAGEYVIYLSVDGELVNSLVFRLLPPGSAPQRLTDLPADVPLPPEATRVPADSGVTEGQGEQSGNENGGGAIVPVGGTVAP